MLSCFIKRQREKEKGVERENKIKRYIRCDCHISFLNFHLNFIKNFHELSYRVFLLLVYTPSSSWRVPDGLVIICQLLLYTHLMQRSPAETERKKTKTKTNQGLSSLYD